LGGISREKKKDKIKLGTSTQLGWVPHKTCKEFGRIFVEYVLESALSNNNGLGYSKTV